MANRFAEDAKAEVPFIMAASPRLLDPIFRQAVVLVVEFNRKGAMGFVINNPTHMTLDEVVFYEQDEIPPGIPVWNAGPVDTSAGFILHNQKVGRYETEVSPGISLSASQDTLKDLIEHAKNPQTLTQSGLYPYRMLVGYSGWSAGQLEAEFRSGAWVKAPLSSEILFAVSNEEIWPQTLAIAGLAARGQLAPAALWVH